MDRFLAGSESATISAGDAWSADAVLDATVPNWWFRVRGVDAGFDEPVRTVVGNISVSEGIGTHVATDDDNYDSTLLAADKAMCEAKRSGQGAIRFSPAQHWALWSRRATELSRGTRA